MRPRPCEAFYLTGAGTIVLRGRREDVVQGARWVGLPPLLIMGPDGYVEDPARPQDRGGGRRADEDADEGPRDRAPAGDFA